MKQHCAVCTVLYTHHVELSDSRYEPQKEVFSSEISPKTWFRAQYVRPHPPLSFQSSQEFLRGARLYILLEYADIEKQDTCRTFAVTTILFSICKMPFKTWTQVQKDKGNFFKTTFIYESPIRHLPTIGPHFLIRRGKDDAL